MIKTIVFDFGDVFINLDKHATQYQLKKLNTSITTFDALLDNDQLFETGKISTPTFLQEYQDYLKQETAAPIVSAWNSILLDFPKHRLHFIQELFKKRQYQLILLSNTNALHIEWIIKNIPFFDDFKKCFDHFYLSHEIQLRKPDLEIYDFVLKTHNLNADEVLFIDDTKDNTDAATILGINTWNINPRTEDVVNLFTVKSELF